MVPDGQRCSPSASPPPVSRWLSPERLYWLPCQAVVFPGGKLSGIQLVRHSRGLRCRWARPSFRASAENGVNPLAIGGRLFETVLLGLLGE